MRSLSILLLFFCFACSKAKPSQSPLEKAPFFEPSRLKGDWNVVAHIPTILDKDGIDMRVHVEANPDQSFNVAWVFKKSRDSDHETIWNLRLFPGSPETTVWKVSPVWPIKFTYYVTEFSADYSWFVLASTDRKYLWVLTREKVMDEGLLKGLVERLEKSEFDVAAIVKQQAKTSK